MKRPPLNGEVIREARLRKGLTQEEVQDECARRGRRVYNISRMENGEIRWPTPRILPVLAAVLDLQVGELFAEVEKEKAA
jgi:transcriptional regulator with XRE-family HTH domain